MALRFRIGMSIIINQDTQIIVQLLHSQIFNLCVLPGTV